MPRQLKACVSFCWFAQIFGCSLSSNMDIHPCCSLKNKPCGCPSVSCPPGRSSVSLCGDTFSLRISSPDRHCHRGDIASWLAPSLAVLTLLVAQSFPHSPPFHCCKPFHNSMLAGQMCYTPCHSGCPIVNFVAIFLFITLVNF